MTLYRGYVAQWVNSPGAVAVPLHDLVPDCRGGVNLRTFELMFQWRSSIHYSRIFITTPLYAFGQAVDRP
jgi:hypothetical protein